MAPNSIILHQGYYGEVSKAHSCINQTIVDPELTSFLIAFSDRPAALPPGVKLLPYISGWNFSKYYVFTKTFPDTSAIRAGMVFTHVLIMNIEDVIRINKLEDIFNHFVESKESKVDELSDFQIDLSNSLITSLSKQQPKYIQETISTYIFGNTPILFTGDISSFTNTLQAIWNSPNKEIRKKIKFRTSFTPSDIEAIDDLTIVSIQKEFIPKWQGRKIIHGESQENVEISSHSEKLFLGYQKDNPFYDFLIDLNSNLSEVQNYGQFEKIFDNYNSIDKIEDGNTLRQDIRTIAKISPSSKDGKFIKEKFIQRLSLLIESGKDVNIKAIRNINLQPYEYGEQNLSHVIFDFVSNSLFRGIHFDNIDEVLELACNEKEKNWWHTAIKDSFKVPLSAFTHEKFKRHWQFINSSKQASINTLNLIENTKQSENYLLNGIPEVMDESIWNSVLTILKKRSWYILHSNILNIRLSVQESILKQLELEEKLSLSNSVGLKHLVSKLKSDELLKLTLKNSNPKLVELTAYEIEKNVSMLKDIDLSVPAWLDIWSTLVLKTKNVFFGLAGEERKIVSSVLDIVTKGEKINELIITLIADSSFSDISDYKNRNKVWTVINSTQKEKFLSSTTQSVLNELLNGKIKSKAIESEISERITSDSFTTKLLSDNRNNIEPVLVVFSSFSSLKDNFLSDYISYYQGMISEELSKRLGKLVNNSKFSKTARAIHDKANYNSSFKPALEICQSLVSLNWWESTKARILHPTYNSMSYQLPTVVILTAIQEEYMAVREHLTEVVDADINDTTYEAGLFILSSRAIAKVIVRECGPKNTTAALETERAIQNFKPDMILFVGIAGSRKPRDFKIGDVIFPEKVYSYEGGKSEKDAFRSRPDDAPMSFTLIEMAKKERKKNDWKNLIKGNWEHNVKADLGVIASGEQVIEHYDSAVGKILQDHFNDTSAVEMEGFGFGKAAKKQGREVGNMLVGVVRGISDIIEQPETKKKKKSDKDSSNDRRPADVKNFASATASAFAFWLIFKMYEKR